MNISTVGNRKVIFLRIKARHSDFAKDERRAQRSCVIGPLKTNMVIWQHDINSFHTSLFVVLQYASAISKRSHKINLTVYTSLKMQHHFSEHC